MASSLTGVDSNGVSQEVMDMVETWRAWHEDDPPPTPPPPSQHCRLALALNMAVSQRDAEYIVECLRVLLHQQRIAQYTILCLQDGEISHAAIDVFVRFLRETTCPLPALWLWDLPPQQVRRLLAALHVNKSVKRFRLWKLQDNHGASWIANLLQQKKDFMDLHLCNCCFPFTQIFPMLRGQPHLKTLILINCRLNSDILLFHDQESTQLFVDNVLVSLSATVKTLYLDRCGVSLENGPLMAGFHQNTTVVEITSHHGDEFRLFIDPILRRNRYLENVHGMLGTTTRTPTSTMMLPVPSSSTLPNTAGPRDVAMVEPPSSTIPPPCSLWPTVLAKVGRNGTQGSSPVFTILRDRLATWMGPSPRFENQNELDVAVRPNNDARTRGLYNSHSRGLDGGDELNSVTSFAPLTASADYGSARFHSGVCDHGSSRSTTETTAGTTSATTGDSLSNSTTGAEEAPQSLLHKKRAASATTDRNMTNPRIKIPKPDVL